MKKRKNIFDLLSLKKKIDLNKKHKISDELSSEGIKNAKLIEQIKELQDQRGKEDNADDTANEDLLRALMDAQTSEDK